MFLSLSKFLVLVKTLTNFKIVLYIHDKAQPWQRDKESYQSDTLTSKNFYHQYLIARNVKRFSRIHQFTRICPLFSPQHPISSSLELLNGHRSKLPIVLQHPEFHIFPTANLLLGCSIPFQNNHKTGLLLLIEMGFCKGALTCKNHIYWCPASLTSCRKNSYRASKVWETFLPLISGSSILHKQCPCQPAICFYSTTSRTHIWMVITSRYTDLKCIYESFYLIWWREMEHWISIYWAHYSALPS